MAVLPVVSAPQAVRAFQKLGYVFDHQTGSHMILYHPSGKHLSIPYRREIARGTLRALIRSAGISVEEFLDLL